MASREPDVPYGATHHAGGRLDPQAAAGGLGIDLDVAERAARLLFHNGQTSEGVRLATRRLAAALERPLELFLRWGDLAVRAGDPASERRCEVEPLAVDIRRVQAAEKVIDALEAGRLSRAEALHRLDEADRLPPAAAVRFASMAAAGAAALSVIFGAAEVSTVTAVGISAGLGAILRRAVSHLTGNPFAQPFLAALLAGATAAAALSCALPVDIRLVAVCPCMVLVPGPHFLNGCIDLVRARIPLGAARIAFASCIVLAISAGLLAGLSLASSHLPPPGAPAPVPLALDVLAAGVAVAAYGAFFDMPWRSLPVAIGIGMAAHALHWWVIDATGSVPKGALAACLLVGCVTTPLTRYLRVPFGATAFASVVSLMPGVFMFEVASDAIDLVDGSGTGRLAALAALSGDAATAFLVLVYMAAGLILPKMVIDMVFRHGADYRRRRLGRIARLQ